MDVKEILKHVDHTLLLQPSTWEEIKQICDDAMEYGTASVCIPPSYVKQAAEYMNGKMAVCTVIGFPRVDQEGKIIQDFHMVHKDEKTSYLTRRYYLSDAIFVVGVEAQDEDIDILKELEYAV